MPFGAFEVHGRDPAALAELPKALAQQGVLVVRLHCASSDFKGAEQRRCWRYMIEGPVPVAAA